MPLFALLYKILHMLIANKTYKSATQQKLNSKVLPGYKKEKSHCEIKPKIDEKSHFKEAYLPAFC